MSRSHAALIHLGANERFISLSLNVEMLHLKKRKKEICCQISRVIACERRLLCGDLKL